MKNRLMLVILTMIGITILSINRAVAGNFQSFADITEKEKSTADGKCKLNPDAGPYAKIGVYSLPQWTKFEFSKSRVPPIQMAGPFGGCTMPFTSVLDGKQFICTEQFPSNEFDYGLYDMKCRICIYYPEGGNSPLEDNLLLTWATVTKRPQLERTGTEGIPMLMTEMRGRSNFFKMACTVPEWWQREHVTINSYLSAENFAQILRNIGVQVEFPDPTPAFIDK